MRKIIFEVVLAVGFVLIGTLFFYNSLNSLPLFWSAQEMWSTILMMGWLIVAAGYYHQGWLVRKGHTAIHVSAILPSAVFIVQCVLFIKGVYFEDWSLMFGAIIVNSGVVFSLYQIIQAKHKKRKKIKV